MATSNAKVVKDLDASARVIERAASAQKGAARIKAFGGIGVAITAIREFCKNWPNVRPVLVKVAALLRENGRKEIAAVIEGLIRLGDALAKVCRILP